MLRARLQQVPEDRLTQATVGSQTASYTYDGDGNRVGATVDGVPSSYLVDAQAGLPTLVDDGSKAYLHSGGLLGEIGGGTRYALSDALGSVRGLADDAGSLVGTASYEAFGATRATSGASSLFGFTGEPTDATGLVYLRARTLDPATGRFLSADTVIPNAPGTSGYNLYAYAGNDPTTWTDPTGHQVTMSPQARVVALLLAGVTPWVLAVYLGTVQGTVGPAAGPAVLASGAMMLAAYVLMCFVDTACKAAALDAARDIIDLGSDVVGDAIDWILDRLKDAVREWPYLPVAPVALPTASVLAVPGTLATTTESSSQVELPPVVIGENSPQRTTRVRDAAIAFGAITYNWKGYWGEQFASEDRAEQIWLNRLWIRDMMAQRRKIIDIGIAQEMKERSPFYLAELEEVSGYPFLVRFRLP